MTTNPTISGDYQPILGDSRSYKVYVSDNNGPRFSLEYKVSGSEISSIIANQIMLNEKLILEDLKIITIVTAQKIYQDSDYVAGDNIVKDYIKVEG